MILETVSCSCTFGSFTSMLLASIEGVHSEVMFTWIWFGIGSKVQWEILFGQFLGNIEFCSCIGHTILEAAIEI